LKDAYMMVSFILVIISSIAIFAFDQDSVIYSFMFVLSTPGLAMTFALMMQHIREMED
jgi:uncharacterized membrane protein